MANISKMISEMEERMKINYAAWNKKQESLREVRAHTILFPDDYTDLPQQESSQTPGDIEMVKCQDGVYRMKR